jgi:hypothetical protein
LQQAGLELVKETDITPNVLVAMEADEEQKLALIRQLAPRPLHRFFKQFAGVKGSSLFEGFRSGTRVYVSYVLRKPPALE